MSEGGPTQQVLAMLVEMAAGKPVYEIKTLPMEEKYKPVIAELDLMQKSMKTAGEHADQIKQIIVDSLAEIIQFEMLEREN